MLPMIENDTFIIRTHRPGDMGTIINRHACLYAQEFNWDSSFEAATARTAADLLDNFDPKLERVFIAESRENLPRFMGCVVVLRHPTDTNTALLRLMLVDPAARGSGLGSRLVDECVRFARAGGYGKIALWTFSVLEGARRLYDRAGFRLVKVLDGKLFCGKELVPEAWELDLLNCAL